ncbi:MAG: class I SAM-dependent methyltransferase [Pseudomonadota bacterium]
MPTASEALSETWTNGLAPTDWLDNPAPDCPVCLAKESRSFATVEHQQYWRCERCVATFLEPGQRLDGKAEKAHYDLHQNEVEDAGYRQFLNRLAKPLLERLAARQAGLDYGCGPGPALAELMREAGHTMTLWDPMYAPHAAALETRYDFITCTEVLEHLYQPAESFAHMIALLKPGGWLGIMTTLQTDDARFANWHYRRDPTHVVFYRAETLRWLADHHDCTIEFPATNVALIQRKR